MFQRLNCLEMVIELFSGGVKQKNKKLILDI